MSLHETLADESYWGQQPFASRPRVGIVRHAFGLTFNNRGHTLGVYNDCQEGYTSLPLAAGQTLPKDFSEATLLRIVFDRFRFVPGKRNDLFYMPGPVPQLSPEEFDTRAEAMLADPLYAGPSADTEFFLPGKVGGRCRLRRDVNYYGTYGGYLQGVASHRLLPGRIIGRALTASPEEVVGQTYRLADDVIGRIAGAHLLVPETQ